MNQNQNTPVVNRASDAALAFLIAAVLFAMLAVIVKCSVKVPAITADRDAAIAQALFQIRTNEAAALDNPGWIDQSRGIVRLPVETAMQITARDWRNPEAARSNLIQRAANAAAPAPAKPNLFE